MTAYSNRPKDYMSTNDKIYVFTCRYIFELWLSPTFLLLPYQFPRVLLTYDCTCNPLISSMMPVKPNVVIVTVAAGQVSGLLFSYMYLHLTCSETGILQPSSLSVLTISVIQCATSWLQYNIQNCPITVAFIVITHCSINIIQYVGWGYSIWPSQGWGSHWCVSTKQSSWSLIITLYTQHCIILLLHCGKCILSLVDLLFFCVCVCVCVCVTYHHRSLRLA